MVTTLGVLPAGGRGIRLRAGPKALVSIGGRTLLERALDSLAPLCDLVVVTAPATVPLDPALGRARAGGRHELERVDDPPGAVGPLAGLVAGLGAVRYRRAVVLGVDFPLVRSEFLAALLDRLEGGAAASSAGFVRPPAVIPAPGSIPQPLVAAYAPEAAARLRAALDRGERAAVQATLALGPLLLGEGELAALPGGLENLLNVNTPDDFAEAERRLGSPRGAA
ncbi:MAG TPA: NTP transferase domain-containing protein [Candidatus Eisenbacteria bacterium]